MPTPPSTDWDACHRHPFPAARLTRMITAGRLIRALRLCGMPQGCSIMELGGGASCFQGKLRHEFSPSSYIAADNCSSSLDMLPPECEKIHCNLLAEPEKLPPAELVFSVGLIEHFSEAETRYLVQLHLEKTQIGGLTAILFPTPTFIYRTARKFAELCGAWTFPDERPLGKKEVLAAAGLAPLYSGLIRANVFSQQLLIFRKK